MKIRLLTRMVGLSGVRQLGAIVDVTPAVADVLIKAGFAVIEPEPDLGVQAVGPETTTAEPPEQAIVRQPRRRRKSG